MKRTPFSKKANVKFPMNIHFDSKKATEGIKFIEEVGVRAKALLARTPFTKKHKIKYPMVTKPKCPGCMLDSMTKKHNKDCTANPKKQRKLKPAPFTKKHKVVHKVEDPNADKKLALVKKATKLRGKIFHNLHCVRCATNGDRNPITVPHHILNKGNYDRLRFSVMNLIPLCSYHHIPFAHDCEQEFRNWLLGNLPRHYRYYLNERDNRKPVRQTVESLTKIVEELQYYADDSLRAEMVIYEKD